MPPTPAPGCSQLQTRQPPDSPVISRSVVSHLLRRDQKTGVLWAEEQIGVCPLRAQLLCCSLAPGTVPWLPRAATSCSHVPFRLWPGRFLHLLDGNPRCGRSGQSSPSLTKEESTPAPPASPRRILVWAAPLPCSRGPFLSSASAAAARDRPWCFPEELKSRAGGRHPAGSDFS